MCHSTQSATLAARGNARIGRSRATLPNPLRSLLVMLGLALAAGCVPVPYRPAAQVSQVPLVASDARSIVLNTENEPWLHSVEDAIRKADPRVTVVDASTTLRDAAPSGTGFDLLSQHNPTAAAPAADVVLSVGTPRHRLLSDTGMAAPFPLFPVFIVGYEKFHQLEELSATMIDVQHSDRSQAMFIHSDYSEVAAGLAYGFVTIAMPESAMRKALVERVVQQLHESQPSGPVRIAVVHQDDYIPHKLAEQVPPGTLSGPAMQPHGPQASGYFRAAWDLSDSGCTQRNLVERDRAGEFGVARLDDTGIDLRRGLPDVSSAYPSQPQPGVQARVAYSDLLPVAEVERDSWVVLRRTDGSCLHIKPKPDAKAPTGNEAGDFADAVRWRIASASSATVAVSN